MATINEIHLFQEIFTGNTEAYGQHQRESNKQGEKARGKNWTVKEKITINQYVQHIEGKNGLGIIPLNDKSEVKFIVIDVDNYNEQYVKKMVKKLYTNRIPLLPFRSKSGGLHLYLFFKSFIPYAKVKDLILEFIPILGLKKDVEIFPKQTSLNEGKTGNWINLPYFNNEKTVQYLISEELQPVSFSVALTIIKERMLSEDEISNYLEQIELNDSPPCLQSIYFNKETDKRNEFLFNMASYLKSKFGDDFEFELLKINKQLKEPLPEEEIQKTIVNSHKKRDYSYKCNLAPICDYCIKSICKNRKYGLGGEEISELSFEDFIQHKTDPPYYEWIVNGVSLYFFDENDIINQAKFRSLCFRELHILPMRLKDSKWTKIINRALKNIIIEDINKQDDLSPGSMFLNYLHDYLENRVHAENLSQVLIDRVYKDNDKKVYLFKVKYFVDFLYGQKNFRYFKITEIHNRLKRLGAINERKYLDKDNKTARVWVLPFKAIKEFKYHVTDNFDLDFASYEQKDDTEDMY